MTKEELIRRLKDIEWEDFLSTLRSQKFNTRLSVGTGQYDISGKKVLAFHIPSSVHKPVYFGSPANTFIRIGSGDQHATENEIMAMYHDQSFGIRSELAIPETDTDMLNAGSFPIPPEKIYGTLYSSARNPTIAKLFRLAKLAENIGFGIDRLLSWKQLTGQNVNIRSERDFVCVTLYFNSDVVENVADDVVENVVSNVVEKLNDRQNKIIELLRQEPTLSASQLAQQVSSTLRTVQRDLARLRYLGIISRTGSDKKGFWTITNNR